MRHFHPPAKARGLQWGYFFVIPKFSDKLRKDLLKVRDKGGIVVVESNETVITTYRLDSYNRQRV